MRSHIDSRNGFNIEGGEGEFDVKDQLILAELHKAIREQTQRIALFVSLTSLASVVFATFIASL
jgi:hypothetical protein